MARIVARLEYYLIYTLGIVFGITFVARYLRNPNPWITAKLLRAFGATVGPRSTLKGSILFDNVTRDANATNDFSHLKVGDNCYIGDSVYFDLANVVTLEDNTVIAAHASFITHADCNRSIYLDQRFPRKCAPICIHRGAWVGFGATILLGITVGENTLIGAQSLLRQDAEPHSVYVGVPATKLKNL